MRICFTTLGCKLNLAETDALAIAFRRAGHQVVAELADADVHVVHGCTVTAEAARATRQMARRGGRRDPEVRTVLTGCYPTAAPAEAAALAGVALVVPNSDKDQLVPLVEAAFPDLAARALIADGGRQNPGATPGTCPGTCPGTSPMAATPVAGGGFAEPGSTSGVRSVGGAPLHPGPPVTSTHGPAAGATGTSDPGELLAVDPLAPLPALGTRALVKIEDGCNLRCTFCIIPETRGRQRSRTADEVVAEVRERVAAGHREVVLTGVQISAYREAAAGAGDAAGLVAAPAAPADPARPAGRGLAALVGRILAETTIERLRLTSIAPWDVDPLLPAQFADPRLCPHLHLSLQSGADRTLERMRRPYRAARYAAVIEQLRRAIPGLAVTTDLIVGFPGESAADHRDSLRFVAAQGFAAVHVFPYSPRPGTVAAGLPDQLAREVRDDRRREALDLAAALAEAFAEAHLGQTAEVLWESARDGWRQGLTRDYLRVQAPAERTARHEISQVQLVGRDGATAIGEPLTTV